MSRFAYLSAFFITISAVFASAPTVYDPATNVTYVGLTTINGTVEKFLNIPYGSATRFAAPVLAPLQSNSVYDASKQGLVCPQQVSGGIVFQTNVSFGEQSEDCLRLKVARPAGTKAGDELPVMVYIYGGGLWDGHINERTSEPDGLIVQSVENGLPVVYVAMNYRLNIFGFALSDALRPSNDLNVGLKDQRLALEWVQQNIALFGGDPSRVTIFGQSSGGLSVAMQVLAYGGARGAPFHGAIMQSTALEPTSTSNLSLITFNSVANMTGCDSFGNPQGEATLECMRALPLEVLLNATLEQYKEGSKNNDGDIYLPTVDGDFLPLSSSELTLKGMFTRMPIVAGWMEDDASLFTPPTIATPDDTRVFFETIYPDINATTLDALLDLYPVGEFDANVTAGLSAEFYRSARVFRDVLFVCPSVLFGNAVAQKYISNGGEGNTTNQTASADNTTAPIFLYAHNQTIFSTFLDDEGSPGLGIIHTSDLPYVFANFTPYDVLGDVHPTSHDEELKRRMSRSWSTFAYNGSMASDPSSSGSLSLDGKETLQGWEGSWAAGDAVGDAKVYVVGGGTPGLQGLESETLKGQRLAERCAFLNSEEVIAQLKY